MLDITPRQVQRLKKSVKRFGPEAVIHKLKGKTSNHHIEISVKEQVLKRIRTNYHDFKPTFASEKLTENHHLNINRETLRLWMAKAGVWKIRKQKQVTVS